METYIFVVNIGGEGLTTEVELKHEFLNQVCLKIKDIVITEI